MKTIIITEYENIAQKRTVSVLLINGADIQQLPGTADSEQ
jgi:hypothetical protein